MYPTHSVEVIEGDFEPLSHLGFSRMVLDQGLREIPLPVIPSKGGKGGRMSYAGQGVTPSTPDTPVACEPAAPALTACCNECQRLNRSKINPAGGLVDCEHLNHGRMQMTPLEPRNCTHFEAI
ncbi:hypothetical protein [Chromatium okenii]|nr:hypothetical protein [Chromatium okenii]